MTHDDVPLLSRVLDAPTGRRAFLSRAAVLGTALPTLGTALAACGAPPGGARGPAQRETPPPQHNT